MTPSRQVLIWRTAAHDATERMTPALRGMLNRERIGQMTRAAVLINTARGPVVEPGALYEALAEGRIFAAALDATDPEPIPMDSRLLTLNNLLVVPHIASGGRGDAAEDAADGRAEPPCRIEGRAAAKLREPRGVRLGAGQHHLSNARQ